MPFGRDTCVVPSNIALDRDPGHSMGNGDFGVHSDAAYCQSTLMIVLLCCVVVGQTRIFNESEMYQRAFLHWNRAAVQGDFTHLYNTELKY